MMDDVVLPLTLYGVQTALIPRNADSSERVGMKRNGTGSRGALGVTVLCHRPGEIGGRSYLIYQGMQYRFTLEGHLSNEAYSHHGAYHTDSIVQI